MRINRRPIALSTGLLRGVAMGIPSSVVDHLIDEFGPDLERKFLGRK